MVGGGGEKQPSVVWCNRSWLGILLLLLNFLVEPLFFQLNLGESEAHYDPNWPWNRIVGLAMSHVVVVN